jgi:hypothetical protein
MKGHHDIYIMEGPAGKGYRVRPAVWSSKGDKEQGKQTPELHIRNLTTKRVLVVLPVEILDAGQNREIFLDPKRKVTDPLARDSQTAKLQLKAAADAAGAYPYSVIVFTDDGPVAASGESEPIVIIDPPPA